MKLPAVSRRPRDLATLRVKANSLLIDGKRIAGNTIPLKLGGKRVQVVAEMG